MFLKIVFTIFLTLLLSACSTKGTLPNKCLKKGETGKCRGYFTKYNFNSNTKKCEKYVYGGCGEIVFNTLKECHETCE